MDQESVSLDCGLSYTHRRHVFGAHEPMCSDRCCDRDGRSIAGKMRERLSTVFQQLMWNRDNHVVVSLYPSSYPGITIFSVPEVDLMIRTLNEEVVLEVDDARRKVIAEGGGDRIRVSTAPHFNYGTGDVPAYLKRVVCKLSGSDNGMVRTNGPTHQSLLTKLRLVSFSGDLGLPWVIEGDSGIHPNRLGQAQLANFAMAEIAKFDLPRTG
jgi:hypothetical protein